jgi:hypothetical protein
LGERRKNKEGRQIIESLMIPKKLPGWLMNPNLVIGRNQEIFDLISILASKTERLIQVYGHK